MHRTLVNVASHDTLKSFLIKAFDELKEKDYEMYEELELDLYREIYGCHFSDWLLEKALSKMVNEDGTRGAHWKLADTTQVANNNGITFDHFNEYDWCYVMNMMYSDYYKVIGADVNTYAKMSKYFIMDKDAPEGKALKYYLRIVK